jgi:hypothetical protein
MIPIPDGFRVDNYSGLARFNSPRPWLEQLACRIDMVSRFNDVLAHDGLCNARDEYLICNDIYVNEFFHMLRTSPLLPIAGLLEQCRIENVELPASEAVINGVDPIRPMTWLDPLIALALGNHIVRELG